MEITSSAGSDEIELSGTAADYTALAAIIEAGRGSFPAGPGRLSRIEVTTRPEPGVSITADAGAGVLRVAGDRGDLALFAANVEVMAEDDDGGHLHIEFPGHSFVAEGSAPLILISPHGGMPAVNRGARSR